MRPSLRSSTWLLAIGLSAVATDSFSQKLIRISKPKANSKAHIFILPLDRVKCKFRGGHKKVGIINHITEAGFEVDGVAYSFDSLARIGRNKRAAGIIVIGGLAAGLALAATGYAHELPAALGIVAGELLIISTFGPYAGTLNLDKYVLETIDVDKVTGLRRKIPQ